LLLKNHAHFKKIIIQSDLSIVEKMLEDIDQLFLISVTGGA